MEKNILHLYKNNFDHPYPVKDTIMKIILSMGVGVQFGQILVNFDLYNLRDAKVMKIKIIKNHAYPIL